jgi:histidyl-tRNA synthetase
LRFDLTVPFARFTALHLNEIVMPFKRYHIAKVWRGENTQRGRYREFTQCDVDIIGVDNAASDFEILLVMRRALAAVGAKAKIHINSRGLFNCFLETIGAAEKSVEVLRTVDKLGKLSEAEVGEQLAELLSDDGAARKILLYTKPGASFSETLDAMKAAASGNAVKEKAEGQAARLEAIMKWMDELGAADSFQLDPSIARGLDYYTGIVFESFLDGLPEIGSVCSGGRYGDLAGLYTKSTLSGVGTSIGLDRLLAALEALGKKTAAASYAKAAVICVREADSGKYQALAENLVEAGIACDVFYEEKKVTAQYILAEKKGIKYAVVHAESGAWTLRDLAARTDTKDLSVSSLAAKLRENE